MRGGIRALVRPLSLRLVQSAYARANPPARLTSARRTVGALDLLSLTSLVWSPLALARCGQTNSSSLASDADRSVIFPYFIIPRIKDEADDIGD